MAAGREGGGASYWKGSGPMTDRRRGTQAVRVQAGKLSQFSRKAWTYHQRTQAWGDGEGRRKQQWRHWELLDFGGPPVWKQLCRKAMG